MIDHGTTFGPSSPAIAARVDQTCVRFAVGSPRQGDQVRAVALPVRARERLTAWLDRRAAEPGLLWIGQRGRLSASGITQVVLATGADADIPGLRPHRLRHSYATRLRQGGADVAQVQALLGHASVETAARYFRAGPAETAAVVEAVFER